MKIASMAPNIVVEVPPTVDQAETERVGQELRHLKLVETTPAGESSSSSSLGDEEMRAGARRLVDFIRDQQRERERKREQEQKQREQRDPRSNLNGSSKMAEPPEEVKRVIALQAYQKVAGLKEPAEVSGLLVDKVS